MAPAKYLAALFIWTIRAEEEGAVAGRGGGQGAATTILAVVEGHLRLLEVSVLQILAVPHLRDDVAYQAHVGCGEEALKAEHESSAIVVACAV